MEVVTEKPSTNTVPEGYKRTEVGVIPEDWEIQILGQSSTLSARIGWQGLTTDEYLENGEYYLVTGTDFEKGRIKWGKCHFVDYERFKQDKKIQIQKNDLLVTKDGTIGKVARVNQVPKPATLNSGIFVIRPREEKFDPSFFYYILSSKYFKKFLEQLSAGSTINHLYQRDIVKFKYPLPPTIEEQQAIAESMSDVDALIAELDTLIEKKQQIKKGAMQQLLMGKKRLPGFDGEWEEKKLGDVAHVQRGASPRPISSPKWFSIKKDVGWVRISDISDSDGKNLLKTKDYLSKAGIERSRFLPKGSLILSIAATVGLPIITRIDTCIHDGFVGLTNLEVDQEFLYYKLKELEKDLVEMGQTGSQNNINSTIVRNVQTQFPPLEEQKAIAQILGDMDAEIQALQSKREKYEQIKQGIMQELLTGKMRLVKEGDESLKTDSQSKPRHNWEFDEAVLVSVLVDRFGTKEFPLGRFRRTKYSYLVRRYLESKVDQFLKKAAGPYNPKTRYSGPETIALNNGYVQNWKNKKRKGFITDENIKQAWIYFENWYGQQAIDWLEGRFRYAKNKELELLTTVDKARIELEEENREVTLSTVKEVIESHPEWQPKLERDLFSDEKIEGAIKESFELFG